MKIGHWTYRDWDCYHDREDEYYLHHKLGICYRGVFFGLMWTTTQGARR